MLWKLLMLALPLWQVSEREPKNNLSWRDDRNPWEPQTEEDERAAYEALYSANSFEGGDMIIPHGQLLGNGVVNDRYRWTGYPGSGKIAYVIDSSVDSEYHDLIEKAMEQYTSNTCVQFKRRTSERDYVRIVKEKGCWSHVGKQGGEQKLSLGDGCYYTGTILHELGHAVGFMHEHQRSDRDRYLNIVLDNAKSGDARKLIKTGSNKDKLFNDFDYETVMIYGNYAFSKSINELQTIEARNGEPLLEPFHKPSLSSTDAQRVDVMYQC